ncbi:MAG: redoxin domain-containing protein [Deltaproteobacteria bacterium]|nr:MAG: redoxin domain-containing protein [Deltaproteobacteria bacterium]
MIRFVFFGFAGLLLTGCASTAHNKLPTPTSPLSRNLVSLTGKPFPLHQSIQRHKATVLAWWATTCPCVKRYQARIEQLRARYAPQDVQVLAVASNADDSPTRLWQHAMQRRLRVPLVVDQNGKLARYLGVTTTPTIVLLDRQGKVRFFGWLDNERKPGVSGRVAYAESALQALLQDRPIANPRAPYYGCTITRGFSSNISYRFVSPKLMGQKPTRMFPEASAKRKTSQPCKCRKKGNLGGS